MRLTNSKNLINKQQLETLKQIINSSVAEAPGYIKKAKNENKKIVIDNLFRLNNWYIRLIKLDQVERCQKKADMLEERLQRAQEKRRQIEQQLRRVTTESTELQELLNKIDKNKETEKFFNLIKTESELLGLKSTLSHTLQDYVEVERELFTAYSNAIRGCYEKQKYQREYTKYIGLALAIIGPIIVARYTNKEKREIVKIVKKLDEKVDKLPLGPQNNHSILSTSWEYIKKTPGWVGSASCFVFGYVPSSSTVTSVPRSVYNYITGKK